MDSVPTRCLNEKHKQRDFQNLKILLYVVYSLLSFVFCHFSSTVKKHWICFFSDYIITFPPADSRVEFPPMWVRTECSVRADSWCWWHFMLIQTVVISTFRQASTTGCTWSAELRFNVWLPSSGGEGSCSSRPGAVCDGNLSPSNNPIGKSTEH